MRRRRYRLVLARHSGRELSIWILAPRARYRIPRNKWRVRGVTVVEKARQGGIREASMVEKANKHVISHRNQNPVMSVIYRI